MLRLTAVSVLVVLALTGFKGRGHGGSDGGGSGGGGGCSSSGQDHDSSSTSGGTSGSGHHDYDDADDYGGTSGGGSSSALQDATVRLVSCASTDTPYATAEVTNPNSTGGCFTVTVDFLDAASHRVERRTEDEFVAANETVSVQVDLSGAGVAAKVDHCEAEPYATAG
ncbi:hypothetical protein STVIR_4988 [Streptomyces viridochromogenes Tue57]|uniref:Uncharacterized protein n=2 Tax=Streptomyces viridochromogenes TaxID=1938 RepID=L8PC20_STRVR|nr:hypothetical protein STVIR_4988 [Streptomyces viridochromogenes Tue57]